MNDLGDYCRENNIKILKFYQYAIKNPVTGVMQPTRMVSAPQKLGERNPLPRDEAVKFLQRSAKRGEIVQGPFEMPAELYKREELIMEME